jgi:hypothetical protein
MTFHFIRAYPRELPSPELTSLFKCPEIQTKKELAEIRREIVHSIRLGSAWNDRAMLGIA